MKIVSFEILIQTNKAMMPLTPMMLLFVIIPLMFVRTNVRFLERNFCSKSFSDTHGTRPLSCGRPRYSLWGEVLSGQLFRTTFLYKPTLMSRVKFTTDRRPLGLLVWVLDVFCLCSFFLKTFKLIFSIAFHWCSRTFSGRRLSKSSWTKHYLLSFIYMASHGPLKYSFQKEVMQNIIYPSLAISLAHGSFCF